MFENTRDKVFFLLAGFGVTTAPASIVALMVMSAQGEGGVTVFYWMLFGAGFVALLVATIGLVWTEGDKA